MLEKRRHFMQHYGLQRLVALRAMAAILPRCTRGLVHDEVEVVMDGPVTDNEVISAMFACGGSFDEALAGAANVADEDNLARIKAAWPETWAKYAELALIRRKSEQEKEG